MQSVFGLLMLGAVLNVETIVVRQQGPVESVGQTAAVPKLQPLTMLFAWKNKTTKKKKILEKI